MTRIRIMQSWNARVDPCDSYRPGCTLSLHDSLYACLVVVDLFGGIHRITALWVVADVSCELWMASLNVLCGLRAPSAVVMWGSTLASVALFNARPPCTSTTQVLKLHNLSRVLPRHPQAHRLCIHPHTCLFISPSHLRHLSQ